VNVGDEVKWMKVSGTRSITCSTKQGKIVAIDGEVAVIKMYGKKEHVRVRLSKLVTKDQPSPVTNVFNAFCKAAETP
jgi:hypothetical protein